jgi:hypothetical protein
MQHDLGCGGGRGGYRGRGGGQGPIVCYNYGKQGHFAWDCMTTTCKYCKAFNQAIEECPVLLAKIQEKQQNQYFQFIGVEHCPPSPTVNVVTRSGMVTNDQQGKNTTNMNGSWVRKAEEKKPVIDLHKIKETSVHASNEFRIPDPPTEKGKGPEKGSTSIELHSDWKASTSTTPFTFTISKENEPTSSIKSFLQSCLKLIRDENAQIEVQ